MKGRWRGVTDPFSLGLGEATSDAPNDGLLIQGVCFMKRLLAAVSAIAILAAVPVQAQDVDRVAVNRIIDQGLNHSEIMQTAAYLTDRIGGRMTNSPQMQQAGSAERFCPAAFRATARTVRDW